MLKLYRVNLLRCKFDSEKPSDIKVVKEFLSFFIEGAIYSKLFREKKWDGYHKFYDSKNFFDYGLLDELIFHLESEDVNYKFIDYYKKQSEDLIQNEVEVDNRLYYYQKEAVQSFIKENIGIIKVATRGGKTFIASEIIRIYKNHFDYNFIFLVDTIDLLKQATTAISSYLGISENDIGKVSDGKFEFKNITVASIQSCTSILYGKNLDKERKKRFKKELKNVNFIIADEVQEFSSKKRTNFLKNFNSIKCMLGLSATPFKQLESYIIQNLTIKGIFGGICYEIPDKKLQKEGFLSVDKIMLIHFQNSKKIIPKINEELTYFDYHKFYIIENPYRIQLIINLIYLLSKTQLKTLVLFSSKELGYLVSDLSNKKFVSGDTKNEVREKRKQKFLQGKGKTLLATNIWKKGITLPAAEVLIIADGGYEGSEIIQKRGRVLGAVEGKNKCIIIDIMDVDCDYFSEHSLNRLNVYDEAVGSKRLQVFMENDLNFLIEEVKNWINE